MPTPPSRYLPVTVGARNPTQRTPKLSSSISARGAPSHHLKLISASTRVKCGLASGSGAAGVFPGARYTWPLKDAVYIGARRAVPPLEIDFGVHPRKMRLGIRLRGSGRLPGSALHLAVEGCRVYRRAARRPTT